jgi:single-stranded-DNA-specific exonuclease
VLVVREIDTADKVAAFLSPSLERDWHDPSVIPGMAEVAARVADAVAAGRRIVVFGDFDLDGISAAAVAARGLAAMGAKVEAIVPHRFREGYGLSPAALERMIGMGPELVVTVDCGVSAEVEVRQLLSAGIDVVVTDHHEPGELLPDFVPLANPKLDPDCPSRDLAGAGVALKLVQAVGALNGFPDTWKTLTDLATLGTIADIVPLAGENRALVYEGLASVRRSPRVCVAALASVAGVPIETFSSDSVAYGLAPRLNAAGRMADPQVALDLLLTEDPVRADELARTLDEHNRLRQRIESELAEAAEALARRTYAGERVLVVGGEGWHEGVKGIVASRLAGMFGVPTFLFTIEDGVAKGSARSVGRVDLFRACDACSSMLTRFGGHSAAVGLTLDADRLGEFRDAIAAYFDTLPEEDFEVASEFDALVGLDDVSIELGTELRGFEPFGHANPRPLLCARGVFMNGRERVGRTGDHLKFTAFDGAASVPAIAFRCRDIEQVAGSPGPVDLTFELEVDEWRGRTRAQLIVRDVAASQEQAAQNATAAFIEDLFARADEILAREDYAGIEEAPNFHTKLAGVTFEGRQELIERLTPGSPLRLARQPENEHDANACALFDTHGAHVGYLNRRLAAVLAPAMDAGVEYDVEVTDVTGGADGKALGVNVLVTRRDVEESGSGDLACAEARQQLSDLPPDRLEAELVSRFIGDRPLHQAQVRALAELAQGRNTLAVMATGRGKSLIFHLHAARIGLREGKASVFVYPLRALVADQSFYLAEAFSGVGLSVSTVTGETSQSDRDSAFAALADGSLDVVLTTPEFLHFHAERFAACGRIGFVVVDEAHHVGMARAGHRPAYSRLGPALERLGGPSVLAVTATAPDDVAAEIKRSLGIEAEVLDPTTRDNLQIVDRRGQGDKNGYLATLVESDGKTVIYVNSRDKSVQIARDLRKRVPEIAFKTAFYNGGLSRSVRHAVEHAFREGDVRVVVATSAFGEGINISDVRNVVLYHLPFNDVEFNQMSGRCGRDGALAKVHLLFGERDARLNETILSALAPTRDDLAVLYRVLRDIASTQGEGFEITNAELAEKAHRLKNSFALDERSVSSGLGIFRDLGLLTGEGHGSYRRLTLVPSEGKVELHNSVRYAEGVDEIEQFAMFRRWALDSPADELLARFNRPILPTHD